MITNKRAEELEKQLDEASQHKQVLFPMDVEELKVLVSHTLRLGELIHKLRTERAMYMQMLDHYLNCAVVPCEQCVIITANVEHFAECASCQLKMTYSDEESAMVH